MRPKVRKSLSISEQKKESVALQKNISFFSRVDSVIRFLLVGILRVNVPKSFAEFPAVEFGKDFDDSRHFLSVVVAETFIEDFGGANAVALVAAVELQKGSTAFHVGKFFYTVVFFFASFNKQVAYIIEVFAVMVFCTRPKVIFADNNRAAVDEKFSALLSGKFVPDEK